MQLKLDGEGRAVVQDGKPVYVHDDGKETAYDAAHSVATIKGLNAEAKAHRERAETLAAQLKGFSGIEDPAAALKALETVRSLDQKRLMDAGEVDTIKKQIAHGFETQLGERDGRIKGLESQLIQERIGGSFARSKYIADKLAIPADMVEARFGANFKLEDGKVVAYDSVGNRIFSHSQPGELAGFDEALSILVDAYPNKNSILKGSSSSGSGSSSAGQSGTGNKKEISRDTFEKLDSHARMKFIQGGGKISD